MLAEETGYEYLLVLVEDVCGSMSLEPARLCTAEATGQTLIK